MGKKGKKGGAPPTQEELDVESYRLTAQVAMCDAEELRSRVAQQQRKLNSMTADVTGKTTEANDVRS